MSYWTDDRVRQLEDLMGQGLSASQIGYRMGITRNAVLGKWHRLQNPRIRSINRRFPKHVILGAIARGLILRRSNTEIARELGSATRTIYHYQQMFWPEILDIVCQEWPDMRRAA